MENVSLPGRPRKRRRVNGEKSVEVGGKKGGGARKKRKVVPPWKTTTSSFRRGVRGGEKRTSLLERGRALELVSFLGGKESAFAVRPGKKKCGREKKKRGGLL